MILLVLFVVAMFLWLALLFPSVPPQYSAARGFVAWCAVLFLAMLAHVIPAP